MNSSSLVASIAAKVVNTDAEGPGRRFALWFQGCPLRCPGCCNPEYLPFRGGTNISVAEILDEIRQSRDENGIEGITLLGGEPLAHASVAWLIARGAQEMGLTVMVFSGFTLEQIQAKAEPDQLNLLQSTDLLVDGPYDRSQPDTERRWIGSRNQRIHFLSSRYSPEDPCWQSRNTLEIRIRDGEITVNGFPARNALGLWKGWKRTRSRTSSTTDQE